MKMHFAVLRGPRSAVRSQSQATNYGRETSGQRFAFTLIELLVVISIIGMLMALLLAGGE